VSPRRGARSRFARLKAHALPGRAPTPRGDPTPRATTPRPGSTRQVLSKASGCCKHQRSRQHPGGRAPVPGHTQTRGPSSRNTRVDTKAGRASGGRNRPKFRQGHGPPRRRPAHRRGRRRRRPAFHGSRARRQPQIRLVARPALRSYEGRRRGHGTAGASLVFAKGAHDCALGRPAPSAALLCRGCESLEVLAGGLTSGRLASARRYRSPGAAATAADARVANAADGSRHTRDADLPGLLVPQNRARRQRRLRDGRAEWCGRTTGGCRRRREQPRWRLPYGA